MATNALNVLLSARKKIEREECWVRRTHARTAYGREVFGHAADAVCWCAIGAIQSVIGGCVHDSYVGSDAIYALRREIPPGYGNEVAAFNDSVGTAHSDVLALFDRAIARERGRA